MELQEIKVMNRIVLIVFINLLFCQTSIDFNRIKNYFQSNKYGLNNQKDFRERYLSSRMVQFNKDKLSDKLNKLRLEFWYLRSLYASGEIEKAIERYEDKVYNDKENNGLILTHPPFSDEMKNCNIESCVCSIIEDVEKENLDILSEENLKKNFANLWLLFGNLENTKDFNTDKNFKISFNDKENINSIQPSEKVSVMFSNEGNSQNGKVTFGILPRILPYSESKSFDEELNFRAKFFRIQNIRKKTWDDEKHKIYTPFEISKKNEIIKENLEVLKFVDPLTINGEQIKRLKDDKETLIYSKLIKYYPILDDNKDYLGNQHNMLNNNYLYIFSDFIGDKYQRYTFKINKGKKIKKKKKKNKNKKIGNDYVIWIRPDDNWEYRYYSPDEEFTIEIPHAYTKSKDGMPQYEIVIENYTYESIHDSTSFNSESDNIRINKSFVGSIENYEKWFVNNQQQDWINKVDVDNYSDKIHIRGSKEDTLDIYIEKKRKSKNINQDAIWWTIISAFLASLAFEK